MENFKPQILQIPTDEVFTSILVKDTDSSPFKVFWLVPDQGYFVQVQLPGRTYEEYVTPGDLGPGEIFTLNGGSSI